MQYEEAIEWLKGNRSSWNTFAGLERSHERCSETDANNMQTAYWVVKAHKEGLV